MKFFAAERHFFPIFHALLTVKEILKLLEKIGEDI